MKAKSQPGGNGAMKWNSSLAIGIEAIDNQHKKIFEHLLAIENAVAKRDPWHILQFLLSQLADYMKFHLAVEEAVLEIVRYPQRAEHANAHVRLLEQIRALEDQLRRTESQGSAETLVGFFETWFVRHVLGDDREYAAYFMQELPQLFGRGNDQRP
jgi:hemerythrin-like metal-binding protein